MQLNLVLIPLVCLLALSTHADVLFPDVKQSPVIAAVAAEDDPIIPFSSNGDLWMNSWADDDALYSGWGDGAGPGGKGGLPGPYNIYTDCGIARFTGTLPFIQGEKRNASAPTAQSPVNDKPSSLLYLDGRLVGAFHSPLGDAWIGYLAVSQDQGATWQRIGFYNQGEALPTNASPWTRDRNSNFRCLFFINMGQSYRLNTDGYVYAMGIGTEWAWPSRKIYLCRVPVKDVLDYTAYSYYTGTADGIPGWSTSQDEARPLSGVHAQEQLSVMLHPQLGRFLLLTYCQLFDAPTPWGPWTLAGTWNAPNCTVTSNEWLIQWQGGYQPGIISKDTGPDSFWFTIAGQNSPPKIAYQLQLGKMRIFLRRKGNGAVTVIKDPKTQSIRQGAKASFTVSASGDKPIKYQWKKNGVSIPGATRATYTIKSTASDDVGSYNCTVANPLGKATSGTAVLSITEHGK